MKGSSKKATIQNVPKSGQKSSSGYGMKLSFGILGVSILFGVLQYIYVSFINKPTDSNNQKNQGSTLNAQTGSNSQSSNSQQSSSNTPRGETTAYSQSSTTNPSVEDLNLTFELNNQFRNYRKVYIMDKYSPYPDMNSRTFLPYTFKVDFTTKEYSLEEQRMLGQGLLTKQNQNFLHMIDITNPKQFRGYSEFIFDNQYIQDLNNQQNRIDKSFTNKKFQVIQAFIRYPLLAEGKKFVIKAEFQVALRRKRIQVYYKDSLIQIANEEYDGSFGSPECYRYLRCQAENELELIQEFRPFFKQAFGKSDEDIDVIQNKIMYIANYIVEAIFQAKASSALEQNDSFRVAKLVLTLLLNQEEELFLLKSRILEEKIVEEENFHAEIDAKIKSMTRVFEYEKGNRIFSILNNLQQQKEKMQFKRTRNEMMYRKYLILTDNYAARQQITAQLSKQGQHFIHYYNKEDDQQSILNQYYNEDGIFLLQNKQVLQLNHLKNIKLAIGNINILNKMNSDRYRFFYHLLQYQIQSNVPSSKENFNFLYGRSSIYLIHTPEAGKEVDLNLKENRLYRVCYFRQNTTSDGSCTFTPSGKKINYFLNNNFNNNTDMFQRYLTVQDFNFKPLMIEQNLVFVRDFIMIISTQPLIVILQKGLVKMFPFDENTTLSEYEAIIDQRPFQKKYGEEIRSDLFFDQFDEIGNNTYRDYKAQSLALYTYAVEAIKSEIEPGINFFDAFSLDLILDQNYNPYFFQFTRTPWFNPQNEKVQNHMYQSIEEYSEILYYMQNYRKGLVDLDMNSIMELCYDCEVLLDESDPDEKQSHLESDFKEKNTFPRFQLDYQSEDIVSQEMLFIHSNHFFQRLSQKMNNLHQN